MGKRYPILLLHGTASVYLPLIEKEGYIDSPVTERDWQTSLRMVHAVKYEGTIPPQDLGMARRPRV